jgi:phosphoglycerate kinase
MADFKTLDDIDVAGKTVLVRGDLNVPMDDGRVTDATRLERLAPTLTELADAGGRVVVISHLGRPKGRPVPEYSLGPVADALSQALGGRSVAFADACIGDAATAAKKAMRDGDILLLENLRYHPEEEKNDRGFAEDLAAECDIYVDDAFSAAHRAHASTEAVARILPAYAGRLMQAEVEALTKALEKPERPVAALVGGAKISTKLEVLGNLIAKVDTLILGGGMANTFLAAKGVTLGKSLAEHDMADTARDIMAKAEDAGCTIVLPVDGVIAAAFEAGAANQTVDIEDVPEDRMVLDIGPNSVARLIEAIEACHTVLWNGPLGAFEKEPFDAGTDAVAQAVAERTKAGKLLSVAGGGDTVAALSQAGVIDDFSYVSTAGGAFLEWLEGKELPGVAALRT